MTGDDTATGQPQASSRSPNQSGDGGGRRERVSNGSKMSKPWRRAILIGLGVAALLAFAAAMLYAINDGDGFGFIDGEGSPSQQYLAVFLLILGDAIIPIFPGETTLNAAATLAAQGELELGLVMLAGALGAVIGDSCLYWIARSSASSMRPRLEAAKKNEKIETALELMGQSAPLLIVGGRYVPGLRFVVNATMGLANYPYRRFLLWSAIGGTTWAIYTCLLAYWVGTAIADYPLASAIISGMITTVFLVAIFFVVRRKRAQGSRATTAS
jgi:membrane-associated protein